MFSGIIQAVGQVRDIHLGDEKATMVIETPDRFGPFELGESIAVDGVCLTVCRASENTFTVDLTTETLGRTGFQNIRRGTGVNLERSLTPSQKISGHFVTGHIDRTGTVAAIDHKPGEVLFRFAYPGELNPFIIEKGSIAVDGISLTVFACRDNRFAVSIIPFTLSHTNLKERKLGDTVNLECDMIGKYVYKSCAALLGGTEPGNRVTPDFLKQHGWA